MRDTKAESKGQSHPKETVAVMGLGYVGLPLALLSRESGYEVIGFDVNAELVGKINEGICPIPDDEKVVSKFTENRFPATTDPKELLKADVVLIAVPTPVDEMQNPVYDYVVGASTLSADNLKHGALVVLESTVNPGACEELVRPIFEKRGHRIGTDVEIAHSPERIDPGKSVFSKGWHIGNTPRVVGSFTQEGTRRALGFYRSIIDAEIRPMKSIREAEAVKILENTFRDINIAFINEIAQCFDMLDIDVLDVIEGAKTKPYSFLAHYPSCGVGGHCIPVDPYYLIEQAQKAGFDHKFMRRAREVNNFMPEYTVERMQDALNSIKRPMKGEKIGVMGLAYKANVDDLRESPAFKIIKHLKRHEADVITFDPHIPDKSDTKTLEEFLKKVDHILLTVNHDAFTEIDPALFREHGIQVIVDGKNCLDKDAVKAEGIVYRGIGRQ
ncbi:MAG TPA: nucleotide sugar dehydrogenase [Candidatus Fimivivens sp.]|nr:nucleotide sugar dehydrogenase [Candidatus Fimivivens sp.]